MGDITGGGLDTFTLTDAAFAGAGFGFRVVAVTVAEPAITLPFLAAQLTVTTRVNCAEAPLGSEAAVQLTGPAAPTAGVLQVHPVGAVSALKDVPAGTAAESNRPAASLGP
jgi:hypothetical protein